MIHYMPREKTRNRAVIESLLKSTVWPIDDPAARIRRDASSIAQAMAIIHGGKWQVLIDHQTGFVTVLRGG
jgi:hypothetical protein